MPRPIRRLSGPLVLTVKIELLKGVVMAPGERGKKGEIFEVARHVATPLVSQGLAKYTTEGAPLKHDESHLLPKGETFRTTTIEVPTARDPKPEKVAPAKPPIVTTKPPVPPKPPAKPPVPAEPKK